MLLASLRGVTFCLDAKSDQKDQGCGRFWLGREPPPWRAIQNSLRSNNGLLLRQGGGPLLCLAWVWVPKFSNAREAAIWYLRLECWWVSGLVTWLRLRGSNMNAWFTAG